MNIKAATVLPDKRAKIPKPHGKSLKGGKCWRCRGRGMAKISDEIPATVECSYSNIGEEWCAALISEDGKTLAVGKSSTRTDALRNLADAIDDEF